jgi:WD40 repeat protein
VLQKLEGHASPLHLLRFSPDGKSLLSVDRDGAMLLWNVASGRRLSTGEAHTGPILGLIFRLDGNLAAWQVGAAWVIHPQDGTLLNTTHPASGTILAASPAGDRLALYDPFHVSLWEARSAKFPQILEGEAAQAPIDIRSDASLSRRFSAAAFSPDGSQLATAGSGGVWLYNTVDGSLQQQFPGIDAQKLAFSPDGQRLLTSIDEPFTLPSIFDMASGAELLSLDENSAGSVFIQYAFSPDGRFVGNIRCARAGPCELQLYDTLSRQLSGRLPVGENVSLTGLAFDPAASLLALGRADGQIMLVDLVELKVLATLRAHRGSVEHLAFSPDGSLLVSGSADGTLRIWGIP